MPKDIRIGEPIPISKLPQPKPKIDWVEMLRAIPVGYGQEVTSSFGIVANAIKRLERQGKVDKGVYRVRSTKRTGKTQCFIVHLEKEKK